MASESGATTSIWMQHAVPEFPPLTQSLRTEICVVGAGIAGISTAYLLARAGRKVVVIDDGAIGSGETGRTTAHLSNALDDRYSEIERLHGRRGAQLAAESHGAAIDLIETIIATERIDCDFVRLDGYLFLAEEDKPSTLEEELAAAHRAGLTGVDLLRATPLAQLKGPCLRFPHQGQFHPLKYLSALAQRIQQSGSAVYTRTHATAIEDGTPCRVLTQSGAVVTCDAVVVATNTPINDRVTMHTKQAPYRTYVVGMPLASDIPKALYWDTGDPYHYVRIAAHEAAPHGMLIVGGEDHKTAQADDTEERFVRLEAWTRARFSVSEAIFRWSGQVMEPVDLLGFIGRNPHDKHIYVATGDSGHGMTHGTIAGRLLTDLILGRNNPWAELYDPARKSLRAGLEFARENLNVGLQYSDWLKSGDVSSPNQIHAGGGAIIRDGMKKLAVYKDSSGALTVCDATCTHLGCVVQWNDTEKSWDCPCHGSRFDPSGRVLNGPANAPLERMTEFNFK